MYNKLIKRVDWQIGDFMSRAVLNKELIVMAFKRAVVLGFAGLFALSAVWQLNHPIKVSAATEPDIGMTPGTVLVQDVQENKILIGMLSSFATDNLSGSATMHPGDTLKGGTTTVLNGKGDIDTSLYVVNSGKTKMLGTTTTRSNQQAVVDRYLTLPSTAGTMLATPVTNINTTNYKKGTELKATYTSNYVGKAPIIRLEVSSASANDAFMVYPCGTSTSNRAVLYGKTSKVRSTITFSPVDSNGQLCVKGLADASRVKLETYGYMNWSLVSSPTLLTNILKPKTRVNANSPVVVDTKSPGKVALLNITASSGKKGFVELYTDGQANKGMKVLYLDGSTKDSVTVPVLTGSTGRVVLKSNVSTGYNVTLAGVLDSSSMGINTNKYAAPKQLEDTRNGFPGKGFLLLSKKGKYIKPYQIMGFKCEYVKRSATSKSKYFSVKIRGLDTDLTGSRTGEQYDQGRAGINYKDYQLNDPIYGSGYSDADANKNGVATVKMALTSDRYGDDLSRYIGELKIYHYERYWNLNNTPESGISTYQVDAPCSKG